jgi:hypothetical protein
MTHVDDLYEPGDDREPTEPDEFDDQPVDLDEVEQRLERLKFLAPPFGMVATRAELNGTEDLHDLAALIGREAHGLIAEVREARRRIAEWEALEKREEWAVTPGRDSAPGDGVTVSCDVQADHARWLARGHGAQMWRRMLSVHPWEPIDDKGPF